MEGSYKLNRFPQKTAEEAEAGTNGNLENSKTEKKIEKENKYLKKSKLLFPGFRKNLFEYSFEYSHSTSIQGIKYIGEQTRSIYERLAWIVFVCISLYFCINSIIQIHIKWDNSPVIVSFATRPTQVWKVPFPAVTICSNTKAKQTVYNFTENFYKLSDDPGNMTEEETKQIGDVALVCGSHLYQEGNLTTGYDTIKFITDIAPQADEMLWLCRYPSSKTTSCQDIFTPILTEEGICYTFNMLDRSEVFRNNVFLLEDFMSHGTESEGWTLEKGYPKKVAIDTYPRRAFSAGFESRVVIVLKAYQKDLDYVCNGPIQGFKIILHNPAETPRLRMGYFRAPHMQEVILAVKPDMMTTSESLRSYDPHTRQCYFPEERHLAFFRSYSQQNCQIECLTNFTEAKCGCVGYQMPHEEKTPMCGSGSLKCMTDARKELLRMEIQSSIDKEDSYVDDPTECNCLPGCTSLVYNAETSQSDLDWDRFVSGFRENTSELQGIRLTKINIFFKEQQFITAERNELYGYTDFLANCGGVLGLFTGFSFLSLLEIIYFLSLRLMCNVRRYGRHYWLWWCVLFSISLYICIDLIIQTYNKWDTTPVLVVLPEVLHQYCKCRFQIYQVNRNERDICDKGWVGSDISDWTLHIINIELHFSYKLNRFPQKTAEEAEAGSHNGDLENSKKGKKIEKENKYLKKSNRRFPGFRKNLFEYSSEYSNSTSIQGIKYIGDKTRPIFERLAWLVFVCISLYFCINSIIQIHTKWNTSPVLVSFATSPTPVWKVPFPAVTICSETKAKQTVYNFTQNYYKVSDDPANMTEEETKQFGDVALVCDSHLYHDGNLTTGYDTIQFIKGIAPQSDEMLWFCQYPSSNTTSCQDIFTPVLTEEGICYTFNMLDKSEIFRDNVFVFEDFMSHGTESDGWTLENGYSKKAPIDTYPRRALSAGFQSRVVILLRAYEQDLDYVCKGPVQGFKIILHNPAETPRLGMRYFRAPHMQEVVLAMNPDMITTSDGLRNYDPLRRRCYFPEERYLAFFRSYSQQNCEIECLTNFTQSKCGCVGHQMPHEEKTPMCGSGSLKCMTEARKELLRREVQSSIDKDDSDGENPTECNCLPGCTSLVYNAETSQADFNWEKLASGYREDTSKFQGIRLTRINLFFKEQQFITAERNELYGYTDFLANCGGLLGLFTGFSFLSLLEIIYFLSLRLMCNVKRYGRHYWSGSQELVNNEKYDHKNKNDE